MSYDVSESEEPESVVCDRARRPGFASVSGAPRLAYLSARHLRVSPGAGSGAEGAGSEFNSVRWRLRRRRAAIGLLWTRPRRQRLTRSSAPRAAVLL